MAKDRIEHSDLINPKALTKFKSDTRKVKEEMVMLEKSIISLLATSSKLAKSLSTPKNVKEIKAQQTAIDNIDKSTVALTETRKKLKEADRQIAKERKAETAAIKRKATELRQLEAQEKRNIKAAHKQRKATIDSANAFKVLEKNVNSARDRYKRMLATYGEGHKITIQAQKRFEKLDNRIRKINKSARDGRRDVGRYHLALGKFKGALSGGLGALGLAGGITAIVAGIGSSINIFKNFEKAGSNLQAILGATGGEMDLLKSSAKELGATTAFTATQVIELQTEFGKLGFSVKEIDNATASTLALASASGTELAEAAAVVGATLGGFGKSAKETARFTDVMAKSFSTSALDMEKFKESMKSAAPAARAVGLTVEKTTALLGTMANAGISGSKAGNNLKTSLIKLNAAGLTLDEGLKKVADSEDKLGEAAKLVGLNAAASFLVLAEGVEITNRLEEGLLGAEGAAQRMADIQLDNLAGDITILGSAWEGFILGIEDGEGAFNGFLREAVKATTAILGFFTKQDTAIEKNIKSLKKEQDALFNLSKEILDVNIDSERRNELLDDLDVMYPDLLSNIDRETLSYEALRDILFEANDALQTRLQIQQALTGADSAAARVAAAARQVSENEIRLLEKSIELLESKHKMSEILAMSKADIIALAQKEFKWNVRLNEILVTSAGWKKILAREENSLIKERVRSNAVITALLSSGTKLQELSTKEIQNLLDTNVLLDEKLVREARMILTYRRWSKEMLERIDLYEKEAIKLKNSGKVETDLIRILQNKLRAVRESTAASKPATEARNIEIKSIQDKIRALRELGIEEDKETEAAKERAGIDPAITNQSDQELQARQILAIELDKIEAEKGFRARERIAENIEDETERSEALFIIAQDRLIKEEEFLRKTIRLKKRALRDDAFFRREIELKSAFDSVLLEIETEKTKALIRADSITDEKEQVRVKSEIFKKATRDRESERNKLNNKIELETATLNTALLALDIELQQGVADIAGQKIDNAEAANRKIEENEKKSNDRRLADNIRTFNKIVNSTQSELRKINNLKNKEADEEIRLAEESVRKQQEIAAAGGNAIIGQEKARLAKLRIERKRELEAQARQERNIALAQNFVNSLAAHSKEDPATAFAKAAFETFAGGEFAKLIAGFEKGGLVEGNEQIIKINEKGQEFVIDAPTTKKLGLNKKGSDMAAFNQVISGSTDLSQSQYRQLEVSNMIQQPNGIDMSPVIAAMGKQTGELKAAFEKGHVTYTVHWNEKGEAEESMRRGGVGVDLLFKKSQL